MPESGENLVLSYCCGKIFEDWKIEPKLMAVDELFRSKLSGDPQAENRNPTLLYSQHMEFGRLKRWIWRPTSSLLHKVSEILY